MYTLHLLNDANEWEIVNKVFKTPKSALAYYTRYCAPYCFDTYEIVKMR
jgi:hypothetical protein